jgi:cytochrome c peroxidase
VRNLVVLSVAAFVALTTWPASADELMQKAQGTFKPIPSVVPAVKDNAVTRDKIELGKMLFFDPRLSASQIISCNSCHNLAAGGVDAGPTSAMVGRRGRAEPRPSLMRCLTSPSSGTAGPRI